MSTAIKDNRAPGFAKNPDKRIELKREGKRIAVTVGGIVVADSTDAITMVETGGYQPVHYFPAAHIRPGALTRTEKSTHCPYKGHATYWTIEAGSKRLDDAAWSYETPYVEMTEIAGRVAFYGDKVDGIKVG
ncbi:MAG: DUF427 domain-containing protein [Alphaproteobacteria bacterium]|nr:DUF427 domain-containing protein [Alphaproteobacteria bacterium]